MLANSFIDMLDMMMPRYLSEEKRASPDCEGCDCGLLDKTVLKKMSSVSLGVKQ